MKNHKLPLALIISSSILFSSCIGSFALFNRLKDWNHTVGNKFVNELVFVALHIVPVYEIAYIADLLVINSIEFWSGNNPVADVNNVKLIKGENSDFTVETIEDGYSITKEGEIPVKLILDKENNTWNVVAQDISIELIKLNNNGTADLFLPGGDTMNVTLDANGLMAARQVSMCVNHFVSR